MREIRQLGGIHGEAERLSWRQVWINLARGLHHRLLLDEFCAWWPMDSQLQCRQPPNSHMEDTIQWIHVQFKNELKSQSSSPIFLGYFKDSIHHFNNLLVTLQVNKRILKWWNKPFLWFFNLVYSYERYMAFWTQMHKHPKAEYGISTVQWEIRLLLNLNRTLYELCCHNLVKVRNSI